MKAFFARPGVRALVPLAVVLLLGCIFHREGAFFAWQTHRAMLREISVLGILACGMTVVILTAGIDLSVGSVLGLCAVTFATFVMPYGQGAAVSIVVVLVLGAALGLCSGALVARFRIQPFIVTLAMMVFARGLAKYVSGGRKVTTYLANGRSIELPAIFSAIDTRVLGENVAIVTLIFFGCVAFTWVIVARLRVGRYLYAIGGNPDAARLAGVPVTPTILFAYAYCGLMAAIAGICQAAQETHGDPETGLGYELDAIAIVVLGGTSLMGGRGGVGLTVVGALTLGYLQKVLSLNAFSTPVRMMMTGVILVAAVLFQRRHDR